MLRTRDYVNRVVLGYDYMLRLMWNQSKGLVFFRIFVALINGITPTISVVLFKFLVEEITEASWEGALFYAALIVLANIGLWMVTNYIGYQTNFRYTEVKSTIMKKVFSKTANMDIPLLETPEISSLREKTERGIHKCEVVLDSLFSIISRAITITSIAAVLSSVEPLVFIVIAFVIGFQAAAIIRQRIYQLQIWEQDAEITKEFQYCMGLLKDRECMNEMRMYSISSWVENKYSTARDALRDNGLFILRKGLFLDFFRTILNNAQEGFLYVFLAWQMIFQNMSFAEFTMFLAAIRTFSSSMSIIITTTIDIGEDAIYIGALRDYMKIDNTIAVEKPLDLRLPREIYNSAPIVLSDVSFAYPDSRQFVLKDVNLVIEPTHFYVIVGTNGAGKTTLVNLLCRLYDPDSGQIMFGDRDIRVFNFKDYRRMYGVVFQNYKIYDYTIAENVAMNEYDGSEAVRNKVYECLCRAGLKQKIDSLPKGLDTRLGRIFDSEGIRLSGGEAQKIALAKALYKDTPIMILDEPSSALDTFAEEELIQTFRKAAGSGKTVIYISHRLSVARYADEVIFINNNGIEAKGPHTELMRCSPRYAEMYEIQAKHYRREASDETA